VAPLDVLIEPFTSRTYAVATLIFRANDLLLHHSPGRYCLLPGLLAATRTGLTPAGDDELLISSL
jgi:hypothetical protein